MTDYPQVTVSIGRNYGHGATSPKRHNPWYGRPMSARAWRAYRASVYDVLSEHGTVVLAIDGASTWRDDSGEMTSETSYTVAAVGIHPVHHYAIRHQLRLLCSWYQQDSVAVTVSDPSFISA